MNEEWKDIKGYEGKYQVSNLGRIKSLNYNHTKKEKILDIKPRKDGYMYVGLFKNGKRKSFKVHRLVAEVFIENPNKYPVINHKDENKSNNCISNLEWCTHKYNVNYGTRAQKFSEKMQGRELTEEHKNKISESNKGISRNKGSKHPKARKVQCITTGEIFNCIREAGDFYSINKSNIATCCRGERSYCGKHPVTGEKLIWRYLD